MEFNPATIRQEIDTWRKTCAETAAGLYAKMASREITAMEAWHRLPGPAPNVHYPHMSTNAHLPEVDYQHLPGQQAKQIFERKEEERKQEDFRLQKQVETSRKTETEKPLEFENDIAAARTAYDRAEGSVRTLQGRVDELEEQLRNFRRALDTQKSELVQAKAEKERLESSRDDILAGLKQSRKDTEIHAEATRRAWHDLANETKQRQERDMLYINLLYSRLAQAEKDAKEYEARAVAEKQADMVRRLKAEKEQKELEQRIEEEVRRRRENAEFERLVAMRMGTQ